MKYRHIGAFFVAVFVFGLFAVALAQVAPAQNNSTRKIVVFKDGASDADEARAIASVGGIRIKKMRSSGLSVVSLGEKAAEKLAQNPNVLRVDDDVVVEALAVAPVDAEKKNGNGGNGGGHGGGGGSTTPPSQTLPWGVDRIDAEQVWPLGNSGSGIDVGVIDTGVSTSHPDLAANLKGGVSEVNYTSSYNDDNGHGSHVAGIIGAADNTFGVVGAAPSVNIWAIKVLNRKGSGYLSDVIDGIDWAIANGMQAVNMSLGTSSNIQSLHDAVIRAHNAGVVVAAAAGNSGGQVIYPAAYPEAIAVAATDASNTAPYWSSRGPEVDLAAPGVSIYSTYKGTQYATLSGTSMATPHVTGTVALVLGSATDTEVDGQGDCVATYDTNCNGAWDPDEVLHKLEATATDLGVAGQDDVYGYGLVNALAAVTQ